MSDLVGNPEDRFSHNEAHMDVDLLTSFEVIVSMIYKKNVFVS